MAQLTLKYGGFRDKLRRRLSHFRDRFRGPLNNGVHSQRNTQAQSLPTINVLSISQNQTTDDASNSVENCEFQGKSTGTENAVRSRSDQVSLQETSLEPSLKARRPAPEGTLRSITVSSDLWSAAFREAVEGLREEIDIATLKGKDAVQLFRELEDVAKEATQKSDFLKGLKYLQSLQGPLQRFKDVLDLASPLANLEPTAATVVGVVRGLTAIAISFANSDSDFAAKLRSMLAHIEYIDDCDTLGRKAEEKKIHKLGAEKIRVQDSYHDEIKALRADQAYEFILRDPSFKEWYHGSGSRQLVILGEMGRGKTVTMAFIVDQLFQRKDDQLPNPKICYYYCRNDETGNALAVLSALLLSLLQQLPGLKRQFWDWYNEAQTHRSYDPAASVGNLEQFLKRILEAINRPIFFVIYGIDECEKVSIRRLLRFLRNLSANISGLRILLSSRPQEKVLSQLGDAARVILGSNAQRDREVRALIIKELSPLAQGSAIWTKMTVQLLKLRDLSTKDQIRRFVKQAALPQNLSKLYASLLARCIRVDFENFQLATTSLKAVTLSVADNVTTVHALSKLVDHRRILGLIHPFVTCVDFNDVKKYQVRLIHQSVKEFILHDFISNYLRPQYSASRATSHVLVDQCYETPEAFILGICIRYLLLNEIAIRDLFSKEQVALAELPSEYDIFSDSEESLNYDPNCT
ncbi:NACHT domain protein [Penicillium brasilianum]|uniref:NACHT domain protein n=1 Tax=Penicillium brasilianum TaxID=104259 RepID=A0A1S9S0S4_PENBI|nr:NACHT domain protein [Penicillium brasilianum]